MKRKVLAQVVLKSMDPSLLKQYYGGPEAYKKYLGYDKACYVSLDKKGWYSMTKIH